MKYLAQIIGASLIGLGLVFTWQGELLYAFITLILVGVIDLALLINKKKTISAWIHALFNYKTDVIIMICLAAYSWKVFGHTAASLAMLLGVIIGHLFWQERED